MESITVITCPGMRPEAFKLCENFMEEQTVKINIQWIIIDDGTPSINLQLTNEMQLDEEYYRGPKEWSKGINTQRLNLDFAIDKIKGDYIFVWEEDDYYAPNYLEVYCEMLKHAPIVGECNSKYYNLLHQSYREQFNTEHTSLCQTAFRKELIPLFHEAVNSGEKFIDIDLWKKVKERNIKSILFQGLNTCIGMKGLPGREGIGSGHKPVGYIKDINYMQLKKWVGEDWKLYKELRESYVKIPPPTPYGYQELQQTADPKIVGPCKV